MSENELSELQREWRQSVLSKLSTLDTGMGELKKDIVEIKTSFAKQNALEELRVASRTELETMRSKLDDLSAFKYKIIGIAIGANVILSALGYVIFRGH